MRRQSFGIEADIGQSLERVRCKGGGCHAMPCPWDLSLPHKRPPRNLCEHSCIIPQRAFSFNQGEPAHILVEGDSRGSGGP
jgi:hypothetical protein